MDAGEITADEARVHPNRSVITRALGSDPAMYADHFTLNVEEGDRLILCSDGLSSMIPDGEIERVAQQSSTAQICTDNLVDAALAAGGGDNVTVVVVDITDDGRARELAKKHRRIATLSAVGLLAVIAIAAIVSFVSITHSVYLGVKDDAVAIYTGVPGTPLGLKLHWLEDETSIELADLPEDTQNRLREGIPQKSLEDASKAVENYRAQIDESKTKALLDARAISQDVEDPAGEGRRELGERCARDGGCLRARRRRGIERLIRRRNVRQHHDRGRCRAMSRRTTELLLLIAAAFPVTLLYALYVVNAGAVLSFQTLAVPLGLFAAFAAAHIGVRLFAPGADPALLPIVFALSGIGITFVTRLEPSASMGQIVYLFLGVALMVGTLAVVKNLEVVKRYKYVLGAAGIALLVLPMLIGTEIYGSKLWIKIGSFQFQPGEFAKVFIVLFLAGYLAENRELLSISNRTVLGVKLPRLRLLYPLFIVWGVCLLVVAFERDLGSALLFYTIFLIMLYVATGRVSYVLIGLVLLAVGAFGMYQIMGHVQVRVAIWLDPFKDAQNLGFQIVQALYSLADGGLLGVGIGKGLCGDTIPVVASDMIFAAIGEEMGLLGGAAVLLLFMLFAVRGLTTAARAKSDLAAFSAAGLTAAISFQAFTIVGGVTKLIPLTGVTLPFMSQGGSSLLASFVIVALLLRAGDEATGRSTEIANTSTELTPVGYRPGGSRGSHMRRPAPRHARERPAGPRRPGQPPHAHRLPVHRAVRRAHWQPHLHPGIQGGRVSGHAQQQPHHHQGPLHQARLHHHSRRPHARRVHPAGGRHVRALVPQRQPRGARRGLLLAAVRQLRRRVLAG